MRSHCFAEKCDVKLKIYSDESSTFGKVDYYGFKLVFVEKYVEIGEEKPNKDLAIITATSLMTAFSAILSPIKSPTEELKKNVSGSGFLFRSITKEGGTITSSDDSLLGRDT